MGCGSYLPRDGPSRLQSPHPPPGTGEIPGPALFANRRWRRPAGRASSSARRKSFSVDQALSPTIEKANAQYPRCKRATSSSSTSSSRSCQRAFDAAINSRSCCFVGLSKRCIHKSAVHDRPKAIKQAVAVRPHAPIQQVTPLLSSTWLLAFWTRLAHIASKLSNYTVESLFLRKQDVALRPRFPQTQTLRRFLDGSQIQD